MEEKPPSTQVEVSQQNIEVPAEEQNKPKPVLMVEIDNVEHEKYKKTEEVKVSFSNFSLFVCIEVLMASFNKIYIFFSFFFRL